MTIGARRRDSDGINIVEPGTMYGCLSFSKNYNAAVGFSESRHCYLTNLASTKKISGTPPLFCYRAGKVPTKPTVQIPMKSKQAGLLLP